MLSPRGVTVAIAGLSMWFAARLLGSPGLEVVAIGIAVLPFLAGLPTRIGERRIAVKRHLSEGRVAPGTRVTATLSVENLSPARTALLLLEDQLPPPLGRPARLVITPIRGHGRREVAYTIVPPSRGRYRIGPVRIDATDPFGLSRLRLKVDDIVELLVTPEIEDLSSPPDAATGVGVGSTRARQLIRAGEEYYTMRSYQEGDDLRRIHWPSVARTGELMIRQHESTRRASATVFIDTRETAIGRAHEASFERAVSAAASIAMLLSQGGFTVRLATPDAPAVVLSTDRLLDALASLEQDRAGSLAGSLTHLREGAAADASLVFVAAPPASQELPSLVRAGAGYGPKLAVLVHPADPATAPPSRRAQLEARATHASLTMMRAGWDCLLLSPTTRLVERWHIPRERRLASNA